MKAMKRWIWVVVACFFIAWLCGYRWNNSDSFPVGIWKIIKPFDITTDKFQTVLFCPPDNALFQEAKARGYLTFGVLSCPNGYQPLIKRVVASAGDRVIVSDAGVMINGILQTNSRLIHTDKEGRALPQASSGIVPEGMVWVLSDYNAMSFDSRYFGPVAVNSIIGVITPVIQPIQWICGDPIQRIENS